MDKKYYLVSSEILPEAVEGVVLAKELLKTKQADNISQAVKLAGISRNVFYKYKDYVFKYEGLSENTVNIKALLSDRAGVFSSLAAALSENGANIITINQNAPVNGAAQVVLTLQTENLKIGISELLIKLKEVDGVISVSTEK